MKLINRFLDSRLILMALNSNLITAVCCVGIPLVIGSFGNTYNDNREWEENRSSHYVVSVCDTEPSCDWDSYQFLDFHEAREFAREMSRIESVSHVRLYGKVWHYEPTYFKGEIHCPTNGEHPDIWDHRNK